MAKNCDRLKDQLTKLIAAGAFLLIFFCVPARPATAEDIQLPGVVQVYSTVSSGLYSMEELVTLAKEMGLEVLVMTDRDLAAIEYGFFPFRNLIKKKVERNSVIKFGPEKYLSMIAQVNQRQKAVVVIPGVQSAPFYYWTGSPTADNLAAHNYLKELLLIGMMSADDYRHLPLLHRGFSTRFVKDLLFRTLAFLLSFLLGIYLFFQRGYYKAAGIIIAFFSAVLLINYHPFRSSRFDAYHGDQGIAPYQDLIDYVNERGGLSFWAHPESNYSKGGTKLGPIKLMTRPYADSLLEAKSFNGFSAICDGPVTITDPGKKWDQLLNEYCCGQRIHPVWGIAGANFRGEADGAKLDTFQTIFITRSKSPLHIIDALAKGRVYAKRKEKGGGLRLDNFSVEDADTGDAAGMGAELNMASYPVIKAKVDSDNRTQHTVKILLVKGGSVQHQVEGRTPLEFVFDDKTPWVGKSYYRLEVQSASGGKLLSNPIFVDRKISLSTAATRVRKIKAGEIDEAASMQTSAAKPSGSDRKPESYRVAQAYKIPAPLSIIPSIEKTISDKKVETGSAVGYPLPPSSPESEKQVRAASADTQQGQIHELLGSELKITASPVPYSIQAASLPSFERAQKVLQRLNQRNLAVYHIKVDLGDKGVWWRLYVGYFATLQDAMNARETYHLPESIVQKTPFANRAGVYASVEESAAMQQRLKAMGYSPYIVRKSIDGYHLYLGAFITLKGARDLQQELQSKGIVAEVVKR